MKKFVVGLLSFLIVWILDMLILYYFFTLNSKWLHSQRKKSVKWTSFDAFLKRVNFLLMFFREDLASLLSLGRPFSGYLEGWEDTKFSISVNHGLDAHFSKLVKLQYVWSKNLPIFWSVYLVRNFKINLTNKLTTKCLLTLSHYTRPHLQYSSYVYVKNKLGSQIKYRVLGRFNIFQGSLSYEEKHQTVFTKSDNQNKFGDGAHITAISGATLPITIGTIKTKIHVEIIHSNIPFVLSKESMKQENMKLNFENDTITVFGQPINLVVTKSEHYTIPITNDKYILIYTNIHQTNWSN